MISLQPLRDQVLVRPRPLPEQTGSILRVNTMRSETAREADILAVGPEVRDAKVGVVAIVHSLIGQVIEDCVLIPEGSILGWKDEAA